MVICLERGADLHTAQLMPLPLTVCCFSKIQIGFTFLVPPQLGSPGKGPLNVPCVRACVRARARARVCVCVCLWRDPSSACRCSLLVLSCRCCEAGACWTSCRAAAWNASSTRPTAASAALMTPPPRLSRARSRPATGAAALSAATPPSSSSFS